MKKLFVLFALLACVVTANAQWYAGGSFGFSSTKIDNGGTDESGSSFKILPDIGYQVDSKLSVGLQIGYSSGVASFGSLSVTDIKAMATSMIGAAADVYNDDMKLNGFTISPYVRYSILDFGKASLFLEGYVGYDSFSTDSSPSVNGSGGGKTDLYAFELGVRPGVAFKVSDKLDLLCKMGALGCMSGKEKESDMKITRFGFDCDTYNLLFGLNIHF